MATPGQVAIWLVRIVWIIANNLYTIPACLVWCCLLSPLQLLHPALYMQVEEKLFSCCLSMVASWTWSAGYQVQESGSDLDLLAKSHLLLMANHQSTADVPILMSVFSTRAGFCEKVMWIMDRVFKFTNFGVISWMHDDFFILAGREHRDSSLEQLRQHLDQVFLPKGRKYMVLFPEGGFLHKRKEASNRFASKLDLPPMHHVTLPRTGALDVIMDQIGPWKHQKQSGVQRVEPKLEDSTEETGHKEAGKEVEVEEGFIEYVVDVTVAYPGGVPLDLPAIVTGWRAPCVTHVHYRTFPVRELPESSEELKDWMIRLYQEKEELLDKYYTTGQFPHDYFDPLALPPRPITCDPLRFLAIHTCFLLSNYLFYRVAAGLGLV